MLLLTLISFSVLADDAPILETIEGGGETFSIQRNGETVVIEAGDEILEGDKIQTSDESVTLSYPDQTSLTLSENSVIKINPTNEYSDRNVELEQGTIHSKVTSGVSAKPFKMIIRGGYATMGVRGTEFTVESDSQNSALDVHTLEGTVEAAENETELTQQKGTRIEALKSLHAKRGQAFEKREFRREEFMQRFQQRHPRFMKQVQKPRRPFAQLRQQRQQRRANMPQPSRPHRPFQRQKMNPRHK